MNGDHFSQKVERAFVEIVIERAERKGFKKGEFAAQIWPEMSPKAAASRWTSIRLKASNTGKPQSVSIAGRSAHGGSNRKRVKLPVGDCGRAASGQK